MLNELSSYVVPVFILVIIVTALIEKLDVFSLFVNGVNDGLRVIVKIFPSILAIIVASSLLNETSAINIILEPFIGLIKKARVPEAIIPLIVLRPLSGSASTAMVLDIFTKYGPDSIEGVISSIIMSSSETTFYVLAILFGSIGIKDYKKTTVAAVVSDIVAVVLTIIWANIII